MVIRGEDRGNGQAAPGFLDHRPSQFGIARYVDFLENYAFPVEQSFRLYAVGTILRRVHDDLSHTSDSKPQPSVPIPKFASSLYSAPGEFRNHDTRSYIAGTGPYNAGKGQGVHP